MLLIEAFVGKRWTRYARVEDKEEGECVVAFLTAYPVFGDPRAVEYRLRDTSDATRSWRMRQYEGCCIPFNAPNKASYGGVRDMFTELTKKGVR